MTVSDHTFFALSKYLLERNTKLTKKISKDFSQRLFDKCNDNFLNIFKKNVMKHEKHFI
jgi:hypothetical protein